MKAGLLPLALWLGLGPAWAGDFKQAFEAALLSDATYQAARAELASGQQNLPMARAALLPSLTLSVSDAKVEGSRTAPNFFGQSVTSPLDYRSPAQSLTLRAPLYHREAWQKVKVAQAQGAYSQAVFATRKAELTDRLATAYLQSLLSEHSVATARTSVDAGVAQAELARRRLQLGEGTRPELADAEAALDLARAQLQEAQDQRSLARLGLRQITGVDPDNLPGASGAFNVQALVKDSSNKDEALISLLERAESSSPGLAARRHAVEVAQAALARNEAGHHPRLDLVLSAIHSRNDSLSTLNQSAHQRSLALQFNLPLYTGGFVSASVTQALADLDRAEAELVAERNALSRDLTRLHQSVANGAAKMLGQQKTVAAASLMLEGIRKGLTAGFNTQADLSQAQLKLARAQQDLAQAVYEHLLARLRLQTRSGTEPQDATALLDSWLESAFSPVR